MAPATDSFQKFRAGVERDACRWRVGSERLNTSERSARSPNRAAARWIDVTERGSAYKAELTVRRILPHRAASRWMTAANSAGVQSGRLASSSTRKTIPGGLGKWGSS